MDPQVGDIVASSAVIGLGVFLGVIAAVWASIYFLTTNRRAVVGPPGVLRDDVLTPMSPSEYSGGVHSVPGLTG